MPKQFSKYLGYFCNKICSRELSKIAQSGHADRQPQQKLYFVKVAPLKCKLNKARMSLEKQILLPRLYL